MSQDLYELVQRCTVKLLSPHSNDWGTGFFVAKGRILTCAHVISDYEASHISVQWRSESPNITANVIQFFPEPIDLALLECDLESSKDIPPCVFLSKEFQPFHRLYIYGYPDDCPEGAGVTVQCEGDAKEQGVELIKFKAGQIRPGHSGAPIFNKNTGKVCGVVSETRNRATALGGFAISITEASKHFPNLISQNQDFHEASNTHEQSNLVQNPFESQAALRALSYYARREELLRQIFEELEKGANRSLVGEARVGKTWLLRQVCQHGNTQITRDINDLIYFDMRSMEDGKDFFEALCMELKIDPPLRGYKLKLALEGKRYILCLDEIDQFADDERFTKSERDQLYSLCDGEDMPFSLVIASQVPLNQLFPDLPNRASPLVGICRQIDVKPISLSQLRDFFRHIFKETEFQFSEVAMQKLHKDCEGKPKLLLESASRLYKEKRKSHEEKL